MAKRTKKKALAYLRVSGRGQIKKDGFPRQKEAVQKYAIEIAQGDPKSLNTGRALRLCLTISSQTGLRLYW
jgi:hypothetical protein